MLTKKTCLVNMLATSKSTEPLAPYLGPVATSTMIMNFQNSVAGNKLMTRKLHYSRQTLTSIKLLYANWWVNVANNVLGAEVANGNAISVKSWIEYPSGTYTPVLFSGIATATISDLTTQLSDALTVSIPNNTPFWTWTYVSPSTGNNFPYFAGAVTNNPLYTTNGQEAANLGASPPTVPGAITDNQSGKTAYFPTAILGNTTRPTFYLLGDSRCAGARETADGSGDLGDVARTVGQSYAYINGGVSSDRLGSFFFSSALRMALTQYCSVVIDELGINESIQQAADLATLQGYKMAMAARFTGLKYSRTTLEPVSSSSDSWATVANQTANAINTVRVGYNNWVRGIANGIPYSEVADALESARDAGKWFASGTAFGYTTDGIHANTPSSGLVKSSGNVNAARLAALPTITASFPTITATPGGSPAYVTGKFANALSAGYGTVYGGIVPGCPPMTLECWALSSTITAAASPCGSGPIAFTINASGQIGVRTSNPGAGTVQSTTVITDGVWHHLAATVDATGLVTLYVDGTSVASGTGTSWTNAQWGNASHGFGIRYNGQFAAGTGPWTGSVDEVAIWKIIKYSGSFTPSSSAYAGTESGLVAVWHLDGDLTGTRGPGGL